MNFKRHSISLLVTAVTCLTTGFNQPAKALGGGVVVSQSGGNTNVSVGGYIVSPGTGYGYTAGQDVNFSFSLANSNIGGTSSWQPNGGSNPFYFFSSADYTALSGNTFSGSFDAAGTTAGNLSIYKSGLVRFNITALNSPLYTGLQVASATAPKALSRYSLEFNVGSNFASVPDSAPGSIPTIASLLSGAVGSYQFSTGDIVRANETKATYASTPAPLPILGVGVAFSHSRRLRKRIKSRQSQSC